MFPALFSTLIDSIANVFWKKSMIFDIKPFANSIASFPIPFVFLVYFYYNGFTFHSTELITV